MDSSRERPMRPPSDAKTIGRYEVLGQLATGGMAEILLARIRGPGEFRRAVVIKRILASYATQAAFVKMFLDEARIVATIRHPNVVQVQELGEHDGEAFLVMEYIEGENVSSLLKRLVASGAPLDPRLAAHVVAETCAGLHAAHELVDDQGRHQNLVHRDVSPQNVIVGYDGHVKLVDFGIALVENRDARTEPGEVKGKFEYMSPEQGLGKPLDRRSDIFSAGIVLYELATGRRLFKRPSAARTLDAIMREPIVPPSRVRSDFPPKLDAIVQKALAKDPADRYATAAEMRKDLLDVVRDPSLAGESGALPDPAAALAERMRLLFVDRIAEKNELLRRVGEGATVSHVPAGELPDDIVVPEAPEAPPAPAPAGASASTPRSIIVAAIAFVAFATLALFLGLVVLGSKKKAETDEPVASATPAPSAIEAPPPVPHAETEVVVHVDSKPRGARVRIGGEERGETPLDLKLAKGEKAISIELSKSGFQAVSQAVVPDADQKVFLGLTPVGRSVQRPRPKPTPPPTASGGGFHRFD